MCAFYPGLEGHAPVRYLFVLLGPEANASASAQMAHALAGMMLDESFVHLAQHSIAADDFLTALDGHLETISILPHVHVPHAPGAHKRTAATAIPAVNGASSTPAPHAQGGAALSTVDEDEEEVTSAHTLTACTCPSPRLAHCLHSPTAYKVVRV